jgi:biopolymer transport protein ExbD
MRIATTGTRKARIEIVPLIDVVFFLLATFVMVSLSMTRNQGMQVQLPTAATSEKQPDRDESVTLTVMENGELFWNKEKVTAAQLPFKLQTLKASTKDPRIIVSGAGQAGFQNVVAAIDEVRKAGITKVGIATEKK